jgi:RimJ/RimL family protein N-acetyltransferase
MVGQRIRLRAMEREDLRSFWKWENDAEVMEFSSCSPERCISFDNVVRIFENSLTPAPGGPWWYIIVAEDEQPIGTAKYWIPNTRFNRSAEVGLYIGERSAWSKGYGSDVVMRLAYALFKHLGFNRVGLSFGSYNSRMARLVEACGIPIEGVIREDRFMHSKYHDTIRAGMLSRDFETIYSSWLERAELSKVGA